jgi:hypothetical protein
MHGMQGVEATVRNENAGCWQEDIALRTLTMDYSSPLGIEAPRPLRLDHRLVETGRSSRPPPNSSGKRPPPWSKRPTSSPAPF